MESYELSGDAMRTLGEIVRAYRSGRLGGLPASGPRKRQENYRPAFYRLATNVGDGEYTARRQAWDEAGGAFADVADEDDLEYDQDITAYDFRGRDDAEVGAAGTGAIVHGWKVFVDGDWVTLVDAGTAVAGAAGAATTTPYTFRAHVASVEIEETAPFFTIPDCLNSWIMVSLEIRECDGEGLAGEHPLYKGWSLLTAQMEDRHVINSGSLGHDTWSTMPARYLPKASITPPGAFQTINALDTNYIQVRVSTAGNFELRLKVTEGVTSWPWVVYGYVTVTGYDPTMDMVEVGTDELIGAGPAGIHEGGAGAADESDWGDDLWTPG